MALSQIAHHPNHAHVDALRPFFAIPTIFAGSTTLSIAAKYHAISSVSQLTARSYIALSHAKGFAISKLASSVPSTLRRAKDALRDPSTYLNPHPMMILPSFCVASDNTDPMAVPLYITFGLNVTSSNQVELKRAILLLVVHCIPVKVPPIIILPFGCNSIAFTEELFQSMYALNV